MTRRAPVLRPGVSAIAAVLFGLGGVACERSPEDALEDAADDVEEAREEFVDSEEDVVELEGELAERRAAVDAADAELRQARAELREAEERLLGAEQVLETRATDVALFRAVQQALLEADCLDDQAVAVEVENQIVTLDGLVATEEQRSCAVEVARSAPGVEQVRSRLTLTP